MRVCVCVCVCLALDPAAVIEAIACMGGREGSMSPPGVCTCVCVHVHMFVHASKRVCVYVVCVCETVLKPVHIHAK